MDKHGTIEQMLEAMLIIKEHGVRGVGLEAVHELRDICESLIAVHASEKRAAGHRANGDKAPFSLVSDDPKKKA